MNLVIETSDPQKGDIVYDCREQLGIQSFNHFLLSQQNGFKLLKAADIVESGNACSYAYKNKSKQWQKNKSGFVYTLVAGGKVVKVGMTEATLSSRFSSYTAGTPENRNKGTCSVTNFKCSQFIRECLSMGIKLEIYAYQIPAETIEISILGKTQSITPKTAYAYENSLLSAYQELHPKGDVPVLCRNTSII